MHDKGGSDGATHERYCLDVTNANGTNIVDAAYKINTVLRVENEGSDWHNPDNAFVHEARVWFMGSTWAFGTLDCDALTPAQRNGVDIEIHLAYDHSATPVVCSNQNNISCVQHYSQITYQGHVDYLYGNEYLDHSHVYGSDALRRHVVNHETGHVLGLKDPPPCLDSGGQTIQSVMHSSYYCAGASNLEWPTTNDRLVVISIMNQK
jgi:hypothetical protein